MKTRKIIRKIRRNLSLFAALCALVAVGYIGYRVFLVAGPTGIAGLVGGRQASAIEIGCNHDDDPHDPSQNKIPYVSGNYQNLIRNNASKGPNLAQNSPLDIADPDSGAPIGYYHVVDSPDTKYTYTRDRADKAFFLRAVNSKDVTEGEITGGWVMENISLKDHGTYAYSFEYRSTVPVVVTIEYTMDDGKVTYEYVTDLPAQNQWHTFTSHVYNVSNAKKFRFVAVSRKAGSVDTRAYAVHQIANAHMDKGIVSITFDDGWQSIYEKALPVLEKYHFLSTQYIISKASDKNVGGYMNNEAVKEFQQAGHEIGSHSISHCDLTGLSDEEIERNATDSKAVLERNGLGTPASYAYPYGQYNQAVQQISAKHYPYMRSTDAGYNDRYFDNRNIHGMVITSKTTDKEFASWVKYAKDHKLWLVLVYHRINEHGDYSITDKVLDEQFKIIRDSGLEVVPLGQAAKQVHY